MATNNRIIERTVARAAAAEARKAPRDDRHAANAEAFFSAKIAEASAHAAARAEKTSSK